MRASWLDGTGEAKAGTAKLAAGTGDLTDGTGQLKDGSGRLAAGAGELADGLQDAANGSTRLTDGLEQAADGAPQLVDGAQRLSDEGTKKLVGAGEDTAQNYGELFATIEAGSERAQAENMAYGAPEGAMGLTAYSFVIQGENGEGGRNLARGLTGLAILGAGAGAVRVPPRSDLNQQHHRRGVAVRRRPCGVPAHGGSRDHSRRAGRRNSGLRSTGLSLTSHGVACRSV